MRLPCSLAALAVLLVTSSTWAGPNVRGERDSAAQPQFSPLTRAPAKLPVKLAGTVSRATGRVAEKPWSAVSRSPKGTQTVAERRADGHVRIECQERILPAKPLPQERTP